LQQARKRSGQTSLWSKKSQRILSCVGEKLHFEEQSAKLKHNTADLIPLKAGKNTSGVTVISTMLFLNEEG